MKTTENYEYMLTANEKVIGERPNGLLVVERTEPDGSKSKWLMTPPVKVRFETITVQREEEE